VISLLVAPAELDAASLTVAGDAYRHLFRARRLAAGEGLRLTDGAGRARWGEVVAVDRRAATVRVLGAAPDHEPDRRLHLLVAAPKKERAAWLVEKATELGVASVALLATRRTPRELAGGTLGRLRRVAAAAVEQSHRSRLPELSGTHGWEEVPALLAARPAGPRWLLDTGAVAAGGEALRLGPGEDGVLLVGPEGGWADEERRELAGLGCRPVGLGPTVLRVETAALAGAALVLAR
jgi:16S rRNA (uracil1498-N3)-methyltransferase